MKDVGEGDEGDEGDVTFFESKKVTKKPVVSFVGRSIVAAVDMKKGLESFGKASFPHASKPLFQFAKANPDGAAVRTAALVCCAPGVHFPRTLPYSRPIAQQSHPRSG